MKKIIFSMVIFASLSASDNNLDNLRDINNKFSVLMRSFGGEFSLLTRMLSLYIDERIRLGDSTESSEALDRVFSKFTSQIGQFHSPADEPSVLPADEISVNSNSDQVDNKLTSVFSITKQIAFDEIFNYLKSKEFEKSEKMIDDILLMCNEIKVQYMLASGDDSCKNLAFEPTQIIADFVNYLKQNNQDGSLDFFIDELEPYKE